MNNSKNLKYSKLVEDGSVNCWEKATVNWVINNEKRVRELIVLHGREHLRPCDIEDVYMYTIEYFIGAADYDINKAITRGHDDSVTSIESYISVCVKYCVERYKSENGKDYKNRMNDPDGTDEEDRAVNKIAKYDVIEEKKTLEQVCIENTSKRYLYGADMYQVMYIKLLCKEKDVPKNRESALLKTLGIDKDTIEAFDVDTVDSPIVEMAKAMVAISTDEALSILQKYVYGYDKIKAAVTV